MQVRVSYFGQARRLAAAEAEQVCVADDATPETVLKATKAIADERFRQLVLDENGHLRRSVLLAIGDDLCAASESGLLRDGDEMTVFSAISGG